MPDEFFELVAYHLPTERPVGVRGGRLRVILDAFATLTAAVVCFPILHQVHP